MIRRRRARRPVDTSRRAAAAPPKKRMMWVRTEDGRTVWVEAEGQALPDPEAVRAAEAEKRRQAEERRRREAAAREPIRFSCPVCKTKISAARSKAGDQIRCRCGMKMLVPEPPDAPKQRVAVECLTCNKPHLPSVSRCDACGDMLPIPRTCSSCGELWLRRSVAYCPRCGLELEPLDA